jgi:hypothetical protein
MAFILADRVKVRSQSTGTGDFTLTTTYPGFQGFDAVGDGNETYYLIADGAGNWEVGRGTYFSITSSLTRDTIVSSSNNNLLVNFPAGGKNVSVTFPASLAESYLVGGGGSTTDSFKYFAVSGQTTVSADSSTDTLTLVAGTGISITTNAPADSITISSSGQSTELVNGSYTFSLASDGKLFLSNGSPTAGLSGSSVISTTASVITTIYSTNQYVRGIKLFTLIETFSPYQSQACDVIAVYDQDTNIVHVTSYGLCYTGTSPLGSFDGTYNAGANSIELNVTTTLNSNVRIQVIELFGTD